MTKRVDELLDRARTFSADVVAPAAARWDETRTFDTDVLKQAAGLGLTGIQVSGELGGQGRSFSCKARLAEIMAEADFGFAMSLLNTHNVAHKLERGASAAVAQRYIPDILSGERLGSTALTEPQAGSDFAAIRTSASRTSDGWILNGEKAWIINAAASDVFVLYAQTDSGSGANGIAAFLVDGRRDGFVGRVPFNLTSQSSIGAGRFALKDYQVLDDEVLQPPGLAFKSALHEINGARIYVAAMCCGMVARCLEIAGEYGRSRVTFGKRLGEHQGWRWALGDAEVDLAAARLMVAEASSLIDEGVDAQFEAARTKIFATRMAEQHLPALAQSMGAEGLRDCYPFGRHQLAARIASFTDGSTEMLLERITSRHQKDGQKLS
ncbi:MAG: acyl-CoA dehydrogenase family protein [Pseudomonadota bacterium]